MSTSSKTEAHGGGSSHPTPPSTQCLILAVNESETDSIVSITTEHADTQLITNTTDSNTAVAAKPSYLPVLPDTPGRLLDPYPSGAAGTSPILHSQSPASPRSSTMTANTEGGSAEPTNALNVPHPASISTVCLSGTLVEKIHAISEAGFNSVEIYESDLVNFWGELSEIRDLCHKLRLGIASIRTEEGLEGMAEPLNGAEEGAVKARRLRER